MKPNKHKWNNSHINTTHKSHTVLIFTLLFLLLPPSKPNSPLITHTHTLYNIPSLATTITSKDSSLPSLMKLQQDQPQHLYNIKQTTLHTTHKPSHTTITTITISIQPHIPTSQPHKPPPPRSQPLRLQSTTTHPPPHNQPANHPPVSAQVMPGIFHAPLLPSTAPPPPLPPGKMNALVLGPSSPGLRVITGKLGHVKNTSPA